VGIVGKMLRHLSRSVVAIPIRYDFERADVGRDRRGVRERGHMKPLIPHRSGPMIVCGFALVPAARSGAAINDGVMKATAKSIRLVIRKDLRTSWLAKILSKFAVRGGRFLANGLHGSMGGLN
jgi:hypothetical protein